MVIILRSLVPVLYGSGYGDNFARAGEGKRHSIKTEMALSKAPLNQYALVARGGSVQRVLKCSFEMVCIVSSTLQRRVYPLQRSYTVRHRFKCDLALLIPVESLRKILITRQQESRGWRLQMYWRMLIVNLMTASCAMTRIPRRMDFRVSLRTIGSVRLWFCEAQL